MTPQIVLGYLSEMVVRKASDLYLTVGVAPCLRIENKLLPIADQPLKSEDMNEILASILTAKQRRDFDVHLELNTSLDLGPSKRFRINALRQRQFPALVIRRIISRIPTFNELMLPEVLGKLAMLRRGLILVTGMTGSGKTTTLAAMIDHRNRLEEGHIVTIEDPIEYYHEHKRAVVTQREVGVDTESYTVAMKNVLRQRPDVILVGEVRDREVMEQAIVSAETGHLCLATLHTNNAYQAIERIVNFFPEEYHQQVRLNLSLNLRAIISQRLVPTKDGALTVATEILLNEGLVKDLILENKITKIRDVMEQNAANGMRTFDMSLFDLYVNGHITDDTAISFSDIPADVKMKIQQHKLSDGKQSLRSLDTSAIKISE